jgi:hypothetical protein
MGASAYEYLLGKIDYLLNKSQAVNNFTTIKDFTFKKIMYGGKNNWKYTRKLHNRITSMFEKLGLKTVANSYVKTLSHFENLKNLNISTLAELKKGKDLSKVITINGVKLRKSEWIALVEDKGIKINLHLSYILENFKVHSVQAVVFDSPLVSFKAERKSKGGISNVFVGITLYDKDGNEIYVKDIKLDKIEILFKKNIYKAMKTCLYYNEDKNIMDNNGINTEYVEFDGIEYIKCIPKHLSSFAIGSLDEEEEYIIQQKSKNSKNILKYGFLKIIMTIIIVFVFIYLFRVWRKKRIEAINNQYNA